MPRPASNSRAPLVALAVASVLAWATPLPEVATGATEPRAETPPTLAPPEFRYDTTWLKVPPELAIGEVTAVAVDRQDHLWVLHRPRTVKDRDPSRVAPPVMEFDSGGRYLRGFGGPAAGYEWPTVEHSLAVSAGGEIWIGGNDRNEGHSDDMLLVFDRNGRFVRQIGRKGASSGNFDRRNFHAPADIYVDDQAHEVYVADGYLNQRVVVLRELDGSFKRMWGAFGAPPPRKPPAASLGSGAAAPEETPDFNGVHGVELSRDGLVYVSDRANQRVQVFTTRGKYVGQVFIDRGLTSPLTASGMTLSKDKDQRYLFVADWGNGMIVVVDRKRLSVIGTIGKAGAAPGEFTGPHLIDTDSTGAIYVAEVQGRRVQRLAPQR